jgi:NADH:ubiquinone oxidoreductase subunit 6 (subunit J)
VGICAAGYFLTVGAEVVAIIQVLSISLGSVVMVFYAITFGEFGSKDDRAIQKRILEAIPAVITGVLFSGVLILGLHDAIELPSVDQEIKGGLNVGVALVDSNFLALQVLGITLFLAIIGSGVIVRNEHSKGKGIKK